MIRQFKVLKMKENEVVNEYMDKLMKIVNQVRLLGVVFIDKRIVEKVLVSIPKSLRPRSQLLKSQRTFP